MRDTRHISYFIQSHTVHGITHLQEGTRAMLTEPCLQKRRDRYPDTVDHADLPHDGHVRERKCLTLHFQCQVHEKKICKLSQKSRQE